MRNRIDIFLKVIIAISLAKLAFYDFNFIVKRRGKMYRKIYRSFDKGSFGYHFEKKGGGIPVSLRILTEDLSRVRNAVEKER